jgi:mannose-6-phosphate isomerase-like protein (cupin superfamily)
MKRGIKEKRPWGNFLTFCKNEKCTVKILNINKNEKLSLQKHKKRKEVWYVLEPVKIQKGDKIFKAKKGDKITIPKNVKHRIIADKPGKVLEISFGKFDEKDEIRLEDEYGRK